MPSFNSDGVEIAYQVAGEGPPILLIHGFASNARVNWQEPGWVRTLERDGRMVISIDNRGHGDSEKLYDPAAYSSPIMADDAAACSTIWRSPIATSWGIRWARAFRLS